MDKTSKELEVNIWDMVLGVVILLVRASKEPGKAKNVTPIRTEQGKSKARPYQIGSNKELGPVKHFCTLRTASRMSV